MSWAQYLNELRAILQVLNYGYIEAVAPRGEGQRAAGHAGAHTRVLGESFAQVASAVRVLRPVTGEGRGREVSAGPTAAAADTQTGTHTRSRRAMSNKHGRGAESSQKPRDEIHHIAKEQCCPGRAWKGCAHCGESSPSPE